MEKYIIPFPNEPTQPQQPVQPQQLSSDERTLRVQLGNIQGHTRLLEAQVFLNGLGEIRTALNWPAVSEGDAGLSERPKLQPMFDEVDVGRLRQRYFEILDLLQAYLAAHAAVLTPAPKPQPPVAE